MTLLRSVVIVFLMLFVRAAWAQDEPPEPPSTAPSIAAAQTPPAPIDSHPSTAPSSSHGAPVSSAPAVVRVHEREVFSIRLPRAGQSAADRARAASRALETVMEQLEAGVEAEARVEEEGAIAVVFVGKTPIVTVDEEDAAAEGITLRIHGATIATRVQEVVRVEKKRSAIATTVFSFSLLVFSALMAFLLLRRLGDFDDKLRAWLVSHRDKLPALRLGKIEVVSSAAVRGAIGIAARVGYRLAQLAVPYFWLLIAFSLFDSTRGYTEKLTGFVVTPFAALLQRIGSALPVLVVAIIAIAAVLLVVRFVGLFFGTVTRGETKLGWLPTDLAQSTSVLVRAGIVIVSLIVASPLITGSDEGTLARAGVAALVTVALACMPILACAAVGVPIVFGRRLHNGDFVEMGGCAGRVHGITLLEVRLEDVFGCEIRVPHLLTLWHPTRVIGRTRMVSVDVVVDPKASQSMVEEVLLTAARAMSARAKVELASLDGDGASYRVTCAHEPGKSLAVLVADALEEHGVALGRRGAKP